MSGRMVGGMNQRARRLRAIVREVTRRQGPTDWRRLRRTSDQGACDPEVYRSGTHVFTTHTISAAMTEEWIRRARRKAPGARLDWHYVGGRACVLALGDLAQARRALLRTRGVHDAMFRTVMRSLDFRADTTEATIAGLWSGLVGASG